jgi:RHS repeat-associated protein
MVLAAEQVAVYTDRLGSVVSRSGITQRYYPHGEGFAGNWAEAGLAFATYERDQHAGLDQAWNRGYLATYGRFAQADPYEASGGAGEPGSWNRYGYVGGDSVNYRDRSGLYSCAVGVGEGQELTECESVTLVIPTAIAHIIANYAAYMNLYASGIGKAKQGLNEIGEGKFKSRDDCRRLFKALIEVAGVKADVDTLLEQVAAVAREAESYVYDGVHSPTELTQDKFSDTAGPGVSTVSQWFAADPRREALSQYSGAAIFIRPDQWAWPLGHMTEYLSGNVNQYGMGTLMHEILHKQAIGGGFTHETMGTALTNLGMSSGLRALGKNRISEQIGKLCF